MRPTFTVSRTLLDVPDSWWFPLLTLDVDGCLLEWREDFCRFVNNIWESTGIKRRLDPASMTIFYFGNDPRSGMTEREFGTMFKRFAEQSVGGFDSLAVIAGVIDAVRQIREAGIKPLIMTDVPGALDLAADGFFNANGYAQQQRRKQLLKLGIVDSVEDVLFVRGQGKAARMLQERSPAAVEDRFSTAAMMASDYGLQCYLMAQPYNQGMACPGVVRYDNLAAAVPDILRLFDTLEAAGKLKPRKRLR